MKRKNMGVEKTALLKALDEFEQAKEKYGPTSPQATEFAAMLLAMMEDDLKEQILIEGIRLGLCPKPDGYLEDGTPVYSAALVQEFFGVSEEEIKSRVDALNKARREAGLDALTNCDSSIVYKVQ